MFKPTILAPARRRRIAAAEACALVALLAALPLAAPPALAVPTTPAELLAAYGTPPGGPAAAAAAERGQRLFAATHGREWSCASCHGTPPTQAGRHAGTGKAITPLAPAANPARFTDTAKVEKWFRRNCNDVLGRECTTAEKADVLAFLMKVAP